MVGVSLAALTYYAWSDGRGSIIFGILMGLGFLAALASAKLIRERWEESDKGEAARWLRAHWDPIALAILLGLDSIFILVCLAAGKTALALVGLMLTILPVLVFAIGATRGRRRH